MNSYQDDMIKSYHTAKRLGFFETAKAMRSLLTYGETTDGCCVLPASSYTSGSGETSLGAVSYLEVRLWHP